MLCKKDDCFCLAFFHRHTLLSASSPQTNQGPTKDTGDTKDTVAPEQNRRHRDLKESFDLADLDHVNSCGCSGQEDQSQRESRISREDGRETVWVEENRRHAEDGNKDHPGEQNEWNGSNP